MGTKTNGCLLRLAGLLSALGLVLPPAPVYFLSDAKIALSWLELAKKRLFSNVVKADDLQLMNSLLDRLDEAATTRLEKLTKQSEKTLDQCLCWIYQVSLGLSAYSSIRYE